METLTNLQKKILILFSNLPDQEAFYLTGDTALAAFFLNHRKSNDLDFFTAIEELIPPFSQKLEAVLKENGLEVERSRGFHSFVELSVNSENDSTIIHIALDSPFRFQQPFHVEDIPGINVDSLVDIASNKLLALFGRAELRDFIDVYFLVREHFSKKELIEKAAQKVPGFDLYWLGVAMERLDDFLEDSPEMHLLTRPCPMTELKGFFSLWRKEIQKKITEDSGKRIP